MLLLTEIDVATDTISGQTNALALGSTTRLLAPKPGNITYVVKNLPRGGDVLSEIIVADVKPSASTGRVSGKERYETTVAISVSDNWAANTVYVASGEQFPNALAAEAAATAERAPLLLIRAKFLPPVVREEILRLKPTKIIVVAAPGPYPILSSKSSRELCQTPFDAADRTVMPLLVQPLKAHLHTRHT